MNLKKKYFRLEIAGIVGASIIGDVLTLRFRIPNMDKGRQKRRTGELQNRAIWKHAIFMTLHWGHPRVEAEEKVLGPKVIEERKEDGEPGSEKNPEGQ